jgi:hypothetical protein
VVVAFPLIATTDGTESAARAKRDNVFMMSKLDLESRMLCTEWRLKEEVSCPFYTPSSMTISLNCCIIIINNCSVNQQQARRRAYLNTACVQNLQHDR